jgi:hypothetical protein
MGRKSISSQIYGGVIGAEQRREQVRWIEVEDEENCNLQAGHLLSYHFMLYTPIDFSFVYCILLSSYQSIV